MTGVKLNKNTKIKQPNSQHLTQSLWQKHQQMVHLATYQGFKSTMETRPNTKLLSQMNTLLTKPT